MRGTRILVLTIAAGFALQGCAEKKQASQESSASAQQAAQTPAQTPDVTPAPPPVVEEKKPEEVKPPVAQPPKKTEKPAPAPSEPKPAETKPAEPQVKLREVTVPSGTELTVVLREKVSTESGKPGQTFTAATTAPVEIDGLQPVPAGAIVSGEVTQAEQAGRVGGKAKLTLVFRRLELPDGKTYAISAPPLMLEGEGTAKGDIEKVVGGAVGGGILGGVLGGKKGAGKGAAAGTVAGGILAVATRGNDIVLDVGKEAKVVLDAPLIVAVMVTIMPGQNP